MARLKRSTAEVRIQGLCSECNINKGAKYVGLNTNGKPRYGFRTICASCHQRPYRKHKKDYCEACGFVALNLVQLDVDHIDGDKTNNSPENLQTLCANCHRLKTLKDGNGIYGVNK